MKRQILPYLLFVSVCALWATLCFVVPDFMDNPVSNWKSVLLVTGYVVLVGLFQFILLYLICYNKYVQAVFLPLYALLGATVSYYRYVYHVSITPLILDATFHTTLQEASSVVSVWLVLWILLNLFIAAVFCYIRFLHLPRLRWHWHVAGVVILLFVYPISNPRLHAALNLRFPLNIVRSACEYVEMSHRRTAVRSIPAAEYTSVPDSLSIIVVLGETARADHLQLNGYERATNPLLTTCPNVVSLPNIYSEYTYTTGSIPHIITRADSIHPEYANTEVSFITLMRQADFQSIWLSNSQTNTLYDFFQEADTMQYTPSAIRLSLYAEWLDEDLLPLMQVYKNQSPKQLFVLHTIGSHWLYDTHVSKTYQQFQPIVSNRDVRQNTLEQLTNSYDNTILYLDAFLYSIISQYTDQPAILLYLSDHGESLGEGGRYLHAQQEAEEEKYPAALVWYSDKYAAMFPEKVKALKENCHKHYRTDYFFYSVLSAAGMQAEGDDGTLDIFK